MPPDQTPRIRRSALPSNALLVIRGWNDDVATLVADARRFRARFDEWGRYGVSAFVCVDAEDVEALCELRLKRFSTVRIFHRQVLVAAGVEVVPTFRTPHVTLAHDRLDVLLFALRRCDHVDVPNRHHEEA